MKVGDLVRWKPPFDTHNWSDDNVGIVVSIHHWVDSGAPDRNFGTDVKILWPDGNVQDFYEDELEVVKEKRYMIENEAW